MNVKFSKKIVVVSYICSLLIVLHHIFAGIKSTVGHSNIIFDLSPTISQAGVALFFFISAYLFYRKIEYVDIKRKWKSRIHTLVIPYILWNVFGLVMLLLLSMVGIKMTSKPTKIDISILKNLLLSNYTFLWFVRNLIVYVALAPVLLFVVNSKFLWSIAL